MRGIFGRCRIVVTEARRPTNAPPLLRTCAVHGEHGKYHGIARANFNWNKTRFVKCSVIQNNTKGVTACLIQAVEMAARYDFKRAELTVYRHQRQPNDQRIETALNAAPVLMRGSSVITARNLERIGYDVYDRPPGD